MAMPEMPVVFSQNTFLEINLNSQNNRNLPLSNRPKSLLETISVIEKAANDKRIGGIVLNISSCRAGQDTLWEIRSVLEKFKSTGKKLCVFIGSANMDLYCLATIADKIIMDEQGSLMLLGYAWGRPFMQHSMEKLGIGVRELRYLEYKSAGETFTRDSLSDADRRQYGEVLDDIIEVTADAITKARSFTRDEFNDIINNEFLFSAKSALERKLVDYTGRKEILAQAVKELSGTKKEVNFLLYGDLASSLSGSKKLYKPPKTGSHKSPVIAVIYANGTTDMERGIAAWNLAHTINTVSKKKSVKALVIRINSPGGSAEAADCIAEAIRNAKKKIPVVVSMGSVAASGGYWASMDASHITASPFTLTGSIGVIGTWFYEAGLNEKLGLTSDIIQRGTHADLMTGIILPRRDLNSGEEARFKDLILDLYGDFTARVAKSRNMDIEQVESVAQGRVFSGTGALKAGLIDSIGGLADAITVARSLAKIPENKKVSFDEYPKPKFIEKLIARIMRSNIFMENKITLPDIFITDMFFPMLMLEELRYRIANNGQVMPILSIDSGWQPQ